MPAVPRQVLGVLLLIGGMFWFLPVLGIWMIPLGLVILSVDFQWARKGHLSVQVWLRKRRDRNNQNNSLN